MDSAHKHLKLTHSGTLSAYLPTLTLGHFIDDAAVGPLDVASVRNKPQLLGRDIL